MSFFSKFVDGLIEDLDSFWTGHFNLHFFAFVDKVLNTALGLVTSFYLKGVW